MRNLLNYIWSLSFKLNKIKHYCTFFNFAMKKRVINFKEIGKRAQSKLEIYLTLAIGDEYFRSPMKEMPILFISQIEIGEKRVKIKLSFSTLMTFISFQIIRSGGQPNSQITGLKANDLIKFIIEEFNVSEYLADNYAYYVPNCKWLSQLSRYLIIHYFRNFC